MQLRPYRPADQAGIVALIDGVYREYGDRLCVENADADLLNVSGHYLTAGGAFMVLDDAGQVRGSHAVVPIDDRPGVCTFRRLYLHPELRGGHWGPRMMEWAIEWAAGRGFERVEFWSDTRFVRAHRFFERLGFQRDGRVRELSDGHEPYREYFFFRSLVATADAALPERTRCNKK